VKKPKTGNVAFATETLPGANRSTCPILA
jgi:hypothetical protein